MKILQQSPLNAGTGRVALQLGNGSARVALSSSNLIEHAGKSPSRLRFGLRCQIRQRAKAAMAAVLPAAFLSAPTFHADARDRHLAPFGPDCVRLESDANLSAHELDWKHFSFSGGYLDGSGRSCDADKMVVNRNDDCGGSETKHTDEACLGGDEESDEGTPIKTLAVVRGKWGWSFFHWVAEQLPRVAYVHEKLLDPESQPSRLVVDCTMPDGNESPFVRETLQLLGLTDEQIVCREDGLSYRTSGSDSTLLSPPETSCGTTQSKGASLLRRHVLPPSMRPASSPNRRVVLYKRSGTRELTTHEGVLHALRAQYSDDEVIEMSGGEISMHEQVKTYATARCQVGPHGAGLVLMMFAPDNFGTAEVTPGNYWPDRPGEPNGCFKGVAERLGQRHVWLIVDGATDQSTLTAEPEDVAQLAVRACDHEAGEGKKKAGKKERKKADKKADKEKKPDTKANQKAEKAELAAKGKVDGEEPATSSSALRQLDSATGDGCQDVAHPLYTHPIT